MVSQLQLKGAQSSESQPEASAPNKTSQKVKWTEPPNKERVSATKSDEVDMAKKIAKLEHDLAEEKKKVALLKVDIERSVKSEQDKEFDIMVLRCEKQQLQEELKDALRQLQMK